MLTFNFTKKKKIYKNLDPDEFNLEVLNNKNDCILKTTGEITVSDVTDLALKLNSFGFETRINFTGE